MVTVRNSVIAKFGTTQERQTPLKVYADKRGPRTFEKLVEEQIQSHIKHFTRKLKGEKKMKYRKRDPVSGVSSSRSNISRAMRGRIPKIPNFVAFRNQTVLPQYDLPSEMVIPEQWLPHRHFNKWIPLQHTANVPQIEIDEARHIIVLNHHQIQTLQPLPNVHAEREMFKIISLHLNRYRRNCPAHC